MICHALHAAVRVLCVAHRAVPSHGRPTNARRLAAEGHVAAALHVRQWRRSALSMHGRSSARAPPERMLQKRGPGLS
jgi:hypothetical protein